MMPTRCSVFDMTMLITMEEIKGHTLPGSIEASQAPMTTQQFEYGNWNSDASRVDHLGS
jgi:hypothetical protein